MSNIIYESSATVRDDGHWGESWAERVELEMKQFLTGHVIQSNLISSKLDRLGPVPPPANYQVTVTVKWLGKAT